jgi:hypothetical protein
MDGVKNNITEEDLRSALNIVKQYNEQVSKSLVVEKTCICCRKNKIKPLDLEGYHIDPARQENGCWSGGTVAKVNFGYGSTLDMRSFYVAICDPCMKQLESEGLASNFKNYVNSTVNLNKII